jgi:hypothetical protein
MKLFGVVSFCTNYELYDTAHSNHFLMGDAMACAIYYKYIIQIIFNLRQSVKPLASVEVFSITRVGALNNFIRFYFH